MSQCSISGKHHNVGLFLAVQQCQQGSLSEQMTTRLRCYTNLISIYTPEKYERVCTCSPLSTVMSNFWWGQWSIHRLLLENFISIILYNILWWRSFTFPINISLSVLLLALNATDYKLAADNETMRYTKVNNDAERRGFWYMRLCSLLTWLVEPNHIREFGSRSETQGEGTEW